MAEMLKFKKGLHASLPETYTAGTVYVTTDEQAMYVDISDEKRIRLGQIVSYNTIEDFQSFLNSTKPPYSTEAFYYVADKNALLKWVATNGDTTVAGQASNGTWKQINSTKDVADAIDLVKDRVSSLEDIVGTEAEGNNPATGLVLRMDEAEAAIEANADAIGVASVKDSEGNITTAASGLHVLIEENAENIDAATDRITALETTVGTNEEGETLGGRVKALEDDVADHEDRISDLEEAAEGHAEKTYVDSTFVTKEYADPILAKVDTGTKTVTGAITDAVNVEKSRAEGKELELSNAISGVKETAENALQKTDFETWKTATNAPAINQAKLDAIEAAEGYADGLISAEVTRADAKYATQTELEKTNGTVGGHTEAIAAINEDLAKKATTSYVDSTFVKKADADAKLAKIDTDKNISEAIADAVAAETSRAEGKEGELGQAISGLTETLEDVKKTAEDAVTDTDLADAIKDFATTTQVSTAKQEAITKAAEDAASLYATITNLNKTNETLSQTTETANEALELAGQKTTTAEVKTQIEAYGYATTTQVATAKNEAIEAAKTAGDLAYASIDIEETVSDHGETLATLTGDENTAGSVKKQIKDATGALETSLTNKIEDEINAANAMDYKDGVASQTALEAITAPKKGDTYVVTAQFGNYYPGDFLIATGEENDEGKITTDLSWTHVKTGYDATLEQSISGDNNKITLSSVSGDNKGEITFTAAAGSATTVSVANNTVTVGIEWDNF